MTTDGSGNFRNPEKLLADYKRVLSELHSDSVSMRSGPSLSWLPPLQRALGASLQAGMHVVLGDSATPAVPFVLQAACGAMCNTLFVSTEMSDVEVTRRLLLINNDPQYRDLLSMQSLRDLEIGKGKLKDYGLGELYLGSINQHLYVVSAYSSPIEPIALVELARNFPNNSSPQRDGAFVVIDSLRGWARSLYPSDGDETAFARAITDIQNISDELQCPVLVGGNSYQVPIKAGSYEAGPDNKLLRYTARIILVAETDHGSDEPQVSTLPVALTIRRNVVGTAGERVQLEYDQSTLLYRAR